MTRARIESARDTRGITEGACFSAFSVAMSFLENTIPIIPKARHRIGIVDDASAAIENPSVTNLLGVPRIVLQRSPMGDHCRDGGGSAPQ